ncbi:ABC transporter ATP-binding protein [Brockia lithotrophica]|uniref:Iron complex transport system ATP-binding protein n=1 Tax=Brockia lithotrophica TaxID=933949 RepID=A0A660L6I6_9BACL|nr:ABC transporter ATP-binding protein [Brockia lithotrophica]RKQ88442.1 iron complex transport system ATP-binding protein [Brockia lithotrophica]
MREMDGKSAGLRVDGLRVGYRGTPLLAGVEFSVRPGEVVAILGPNGVGKSTVLKTILGFLRPLGGKAYWVGKDGDTLPPLRVAGYVPQQAEVAFGYTALDYVLMGRTPHLGLFSAPGARDVELARAALRRVGVEHLAARGVSSLSGGEFRRVLVARALARVPELLVLDEPEAHLDVRQRLEVLALLRELADRERLAVLFTTHAPEAALGFADRAVLFFSDGTTEAVSLPAGLTEGRLERLYGVPFVRLELPPSGKDGVPFVPVPVFPSTFRQGAHRDRGVK